jgi:hypothetical protein
MNPFPPYSSVAESKLAGRYITNTHIEPLLSDYNHSIIGHSTSGLPIYRIRMGTGSTKVLMWSQMHGNESTTTKSLFDLLHFLNTNPDWLDNLQLSIIPILNPDGAKAYTRVNANQVDLNRDAINLSQIESRVLREEFDQFSPDFAFNLHDQRTIFGVNGKPATVSLLAPAFDLDRNYNSCRTLAAQLASTIFVGLQPLIGSQIGRFDDSFNPNCVGDAFQSAGVPTLLIEAGHYPDDYSREQTREYVFYAYILVLEAIASSTFGNVSVYHSIPKNQKIFFDFLLRDVSFMENSSQQRGDVGLQYQEVLQNDSIAFQAVFAAAGDLSHCHGHIEPNCEKLNRIDFKIEESAQNVLNTLDL